MLLLDLSLPHRSGLDLLSDLAELDPRPRVVIVTMHVDRAMADMTIRLAKSKEGTRDRYYWAKVVKENSKAKV